MFLLWWGPWSFSASHVWVHENSWQRSYWPVSGSWWHSKFGWIRFDHEKGDIDQGPLSWGPAVLLATTRAAARLQLHHYTVWLQACLNRGSSLSSNGFVSDLWGFKNMFNQPDPSCMLQSQSLDISGQGSPQSPQRSQLRSSLKRTPGRLVRSDMLW